MSNPCEGFSLGSACATLLFIYLVRKRMTRTATPSRGGAFAKAVAKQAAKKGFFKLLGVFLRRH